MGPHSRTYRSRCSELRRALSRESGGDRLMARVLDLVLTAGLEAVLVAVELALSLLVLIPPIANTARYERLRDIQAADHA